MPAQREHLLRFVDITLCITARQRPQHRQRGAHRAAQQLGDADHAPFAVRIEQRRFDRRLGEGIALHDAPDALHGGIDIGCFGALHRRCDEGIDADLYAFRTLVAIRQSADRRRFTHPFDAVAAHHAHQQQGAPLDDRHRQQMRPNHRQVDENGRYAPDRNHGHSDAARGAASSLPAPTIAAKAARKSAMLRLTAVPNKRSPTAASLPPSLRSALYESSVTRSRGRRVMRAVPFAKPAPAPLSVPAKVTALRYSGSVSVIRPLKPAFSGPTLTCRTAAYSVSDLRSTDLQPGEHPCSTAGSNNAAQIASGVAFRSTWPTSSMIFCLNLCVDGIDVRGRGERR